MTRTTMRDHRHRARGAPSASAAHLYPDGDTRLAVQNILALLPPPATSHALLAAMLLNGLPKFRELVGAADSTTDAWTSWNPSMLPTEPLFGMAAIDKGTFRIGENEKLRNERLSSLNS
ncbi:unnamed protein product [Haemonchus placei]|uniref:Type I-E CRISPR-associated protein Cse1/CasA n=1 Tax=Haemonchus placei TaxID=6290 RepID=A0A0N4W178_HAEPC|nr:unnamed protein product [Haemonchus placei]